MEPLVQETGERQGKMLMPSEQGGGTVAEGLRVTGRIISQASFGTNDSGFQAVAYIQANKEKQFAYEVAARTRCLETLSTVIALSFTNYANLTE